MTRAHPQLARLGRCRALDPLRAHQRAGSGIGVRGVCDLEEKNLLLNPEHADFGRVEIGKPSKFTFDGRMFKGKP